VFDMRAMSNVNTFFKKPKVTDRMR
jgi:hypothetical protein